jgi:hypothetical protein
VLKMSLLNVESDKYNYYAKDMQCGLAVAESRVSCACIDSMHTSTTSAQR